MIDRNISASRVVAAALWTASLLVWVTSWGTEISELATLAIIFAAAAGTAQVRGYLVEQHAKIKTALTVTATVPPKSVVPITRKQ